MTNILHVILLEYLELVLAENSRSSPCHHSRGLVTTTFVKPRLDCDLNYFMKSSCKRPLQKAAVTAFGITQMDGVVAYESFDCI